MNSKSIYIYNYYQTGYLVRYIISKIVILVTVSTLYVRVNRNYPMMGLVILPDLIIYLGLSSINNYWGTKISTQSVVHWNKNNLYVGNCNCIKLCLRQCYICDIYNIIYDPLHMLVTDNLLPIQSSMEVIRTYEFYILCIFRSYYVNTIYLHMLQVG